MPPSWPVKVLWTSRLSSAREVQDERESSFRSICRFAERGFDAGTIWDEDLPGAEGRVIAARVKSEGRIPADPRSGFRQHAGIVVLRLEKQDKATVVAYVARIVAALGQRSPIGELWIVQKDRIRFRAGS